MARAKIELLWLGLSLGLARPRDNIGLLQLGPSPGLVRLGQSYGQE